MWLTPMGIAATPMPSGQTWPRNSSTVVTPGGSLVHPLQEREPDGELNLEEWAGVGEVAADLGYLESGDALERGICPIDSFVDRSFDGGRRPHEVDRLLHCHRLLLGVTNRPRFTRSMVYCQRRPCPFFPLIGTMAVGDRRPLAGNRRRLRWPEMTEINEAAEFH